MAVLGVGIFVSACLTGQDQGHDQLIASIKDRHGNSKQLIKSIVAEYEVSDWFGPGKAPNSRRRLSWYQDGDLVRCKSQTTLFDALAPKDKLGGTTKPMLLQEDFLLKNGELKSLRRQGSSPKGSASFRPFQPKQELVQNLWADALFVLFKKKGVTLLELLEDATKIRSLETLRDGQHVLYRLTVDVSDSGSKQQLVIDVDRRHNYLVTRLAEEDLPAEKGSIRSEIKALTFREVAPGIYFPMKLERRAYSLGPDNKQNLLSTIEVRFETVTVNETIDPDRFELTLPPGTSVVDYRDNTSYLIGPDGRPTDKVNVVPKPIQKVVQPTYKEEPSKISPFLWGAVFFLACAAFVLYAYRRKRPTKNGA